MQDKRKLKIAQIAPIAERVPPKKYGGTERVVYALTEELVRRGHDVTLFATGDSKTSAKLVSVYPKSLRQAKVKDPYGTNPQTMLNVGYAYSQQQKFDVIHDHMGNLSIATANMAETPVVMTIHGVIDPNYAKLLSTFRNPRLVTISNSQQKPAPNLNYAGTVYNGLDMTNYPFSSSHDGYLLFVGRISMEKGVHFAIQVAEELDLPLIIAAKLDDVDKPYFDQHIKNHLKGKIKWVGEVNEQQRNRLMSRALCFLHPVTWNEPFGLTLIEAMACGCPVVAFDKGSIPEIVIDGKTGYVVKNINAMIDDVYTVKKLINRRDCREHALTNFNSERMTDAYEEIYFQILSQEMVKVVAPPVIPDLTPLVTNFPFVVDPTKPES